MDSTEKIKTALIFEGGGCKGAFEAGIIQYLSEQYLSKKKYPINLVGGTSVGGLNAACFAFNKIDDLLKLWNGIQNDKVYSPPNLLDLVSYLDKKADKETIQEVKNFTHQLLSWFSDHSFLCYINIARIISLFFAAKNIAKKLSLDSEHEQALKTAIFNILEKNSLLDNTPLRQTLEGLFGQQKVTDAPIHLYITAFQLQSEELTIFGPDAKAENKDALVVDALMATSAIQGAFPVKTIGGLQYIDGGNGANLPLAYAVNHQCNRIILARDNTESQATNKLFNKIWEVILRAYLASFGNLTIRDIQWANDISKRIKAEENNMELLKGFESEIQDRPIKEKFEQMFSKLQPVFSNKIPIEIIEIFPSWTPDNIIDFNQATSQRLIKDGFKQASEKLSNL